jgi:hypothetical protein
MVFALDIDDGGVRAFSSTEEAESCCKAVDVEDGYWKFFDDDGSPLEARFTPSGAYALQRALSGLWLQERLPQVTKVEGCGLATIAELVEIMKVNRGKRAARGGHR